MEMLLMMTVLSKTLLFPKVQISAAKFLKVYITITSHANVMGISSHATAFQSFASHSFSILFGQECSPQPPGKSHNSGFCLPPIAVTKINNKKIQ